MHEMEKHPRCSQILQRCIIAQTGKWGRREEGRKRQTMKEDDQRTRFQVRGWRREGTVMRQTGPTSRSQTTAASSHPSIPPSLHLSILFSPAFCHTAAQTEKLPFTSPGLCSRIPRHTPTPPRALFCPATEKRRGGGTIATLLNLF